MEKSSVRLWLLVLMLVLLIILFVQLPDYLNKTSEITINNSPPVTQDHLKDVDWVELFKTIPYNIERCYDFNQNRSLEPGFAEDYDKFLAEVKKQGPTMGNCGQDVYREVYIFMQDIVKAPFIKTVCETGFNAGHSSFGWLRSNPNVQVYSFDIGTNAYSRPMQEYLSKTFPGRHHVTWGDSTKTLPEFREKNPDFRCDFILIDGGHYYHVVRSDFANFREMANPVHLLMMDNYPDARFMWMGDMWEGAKRKSELIEVFNCHYGERDPEGISVGRYNL